MTPRFVEVVPTSGSHLNTFVIPIGWSPNIGNAFFALGIKHVLEQAVPNARVVLFSDQAAYLNLVPGPNYRREPRNSLHYLEYIRPDYIVLTGSLLTKQFPQVWGTSLKSLVQAGTKILLIGVGHYDYSPEEIEVCRNLLREYPPYVFVSRDHQTYENLHDIAECSYDGIDGAYFTPDIFQPIRTDLPPYVVLNFDKTPEPRIRALSNSVFQPDKLLYETFNFDFQGQEWLVQFPKLRLAASRFLGKGFSFLLGPLGLCGTKQKRFGDFMIVRTDHQLNPIMIRRIFRGPNAFAGDIPYTYLNIYAQTELTLTDRIHAALVTMAYGRPAMLFSQSGRALIIEEVGGEGVTRGPTNLDMDVLARRKQAMISFLRSVPW